MLGPCDKGVILTLYERETDPIDIERLSSHTLDAETEKLQKTTQKAWDK